MKKGFTLIELLVVVLIIGILAAVALPQYQAAVMKSRLVQLMAVVDKMWEAQQVYYLANGEYSNDAKALDIQWPAGYTKEWDTGVAYPFGACQMYSNTYHEVWCTVSDESLMFLRPLGNRSAQCRVYKGKPLEAAAGRACKSLGGTYMGGGEFYSTYFVQEK